MGQQSNFRAHVWQTVIILLPVLGGLIAIYITIRTDLSKALDDNVRQDSMIVGIQREERENAAEVQKAWRDVKDILAQVQRDAAVAAALARKR
jgi:hypothetical protein